MQDAPKRMKRLVREWAGIAHDRDLRTALGELRIQFGRWERGEISSFVLRKEELPADLLQHIASLIEFYEADLASS